MRFLMYMLFASIPAFSFAQQLKNDTFESLRKEADSFLNNWHAAAANADFDTYFNAMSETFVFIGTDATEKWNKKAFEKYAAPHFKKGKAWSFKVLDRSLYFENDTGKKSVIVWFDELLQTQMGICRGSGVLRYKNQQYQLLHYVLSLTIPNTVVPEVKRLKDSEKQDLQDLFNLSK